jgi:pimeloyl-ACP methyl ester carboxylesterase
MKRKPITIEKTICNPEGREFAFDITLPATAPPPAGFPLLIFAHGFKGFKDWGFWYRLAEEFAASGYAFLKFDYSFNGTRPGDQGAFSDLEAFGRNTFSREQADWQSILSWVESNGRELSLLTHSIGLIGHSRSGPQALLTAARDSRAGFAITWASVQGLGYAWTNAAELEKWKREGVLYAQNARTGQDMPLYYSLYEDFMDNGDRFSLQKNLVNFTKPVLLVHGQNDVPVPFQASLQLKQLMPHARLNLIPEADHVFGGHHPFGREEKLPKQAEDLLQACLSFLKEIQAD